MLCIFRIFIELTVPFMLLSNIKRSKGEKSFKNFLETYLSYNIEMDKKSAESMK